MALAEGVLSLFPITVFLVMIPLAGASGSGRGSSEDDAVDSLKVGRLPDFRADSAEICEHMFMFYKRALQGEYADLYISHPNLTRLSLP